MPRFASSSPSEGPDCDAGVDPVTHGYLSSPSAECQSALEALGKRIWTCVAITQQSIIKLFFSMLFA